MNIEMSLLFGAIGTLVGVIGVLASFKKTSALEGENNARTDEKLNYITRGVDDIRIDQRAQAVKVENLNLELSEVRSSVKSAHKRIDDMTKIKEYET